MTTRYAYNTETTIQIVAHWCDHPNGCGIAYGLPQGFIEARRKDHKTWYCPNGCKAHYPAGKTDEQKLREAQARETALQDQLAAAVRDAEATRVALIRDRHRFANGVCPCCDRYFANVHRHVSSQHPDYDVTKVRQSVEAKFRCSCGRNFESPRGLAIHQGHHRRDGWDKPGVSKWSAHLTEVGAR
jgi:hypothetical protein